MLVVQFVGNSEVVFSKEKERNLTAVTPSQLSIAYHGEIRSEVSFESIESYIDCVYGIYPFRKQGRKKK